MVFSVCDLVAEFATLEKYISETLSIFRFSYQKAQCVWLISCLHEFPNMS